MRCIFGLILAITTLASPAYASQPALPTSVFEKLKESKLPENAKLKFKDWVRRDKAAWNRLRRAEKVAAKADTAEKFYAKLQPAGREWGKTYKALGVELLRGKWPSNISVEIEQLGTLCIDAGSRALMIFEATSYSDYVKRSEYKVPDLGQSYQSLIAQINSKLGI